MVDVFLIKDGLIENVIVIESVEYALSLLPDYTILERVDSNRHLNPGDPAP